MWLIPEVIAQLDLKRALHQPLGQLRQQAPRPNDLLLRSRAGQQLVNDVVRTALPPLSSWSQPGRDRMAGAPQRLTTS